MENKQTAVEWLMENIQKAHKMDWDMVFLHAKIIEKQQIIEACEQFGKPPFDVKDYQKYYNEKYGSEWKVNI